MFRILLVCTGNTCRSPMAEVLLKGKAQNSNPLQQIKVISAGTIGGNGGASRQAIRVMKKRGLDLDGHMSRQLTSELVAEADLILTMAQSHKRAVLSLAPDAWGKIFTLTEFAGEEGDIADPFGGGENLYEMCAQQLASLIDKSWEKITLLAGDRA